MKNFLTVIAFAMLIFHQDFWLWENTYLFLGVLPSGLVYHACFSIVVAILAALAIRFAWPHDLERWARGETKSTDLPGKPYNVR